MGEAEQQQAAERAKALGLSEKKRKAPRVRGFEYGLP